MQHAGGERSRLGKDGVLAAGLKDRDQLFGEADEEDQDDRRVGPAHLQTGAGHALGDLRPARTHVAPDQLTTPIWMPSSGTKETMSQLKTMVTAVAVARPGNGREGSCW